MPQQATKASEGLRAALESTNLAETLDEDELTRIGMEARRGYEVDKESREEWEKNAEGWVKLASQIQEQRSFPWQNSSSVKYPLMTTAATQFAARAYPSLVPSNGQIVKSRVLGKDPTGEKLALADRVSTYMSYQVMYEIVNWEEDMDKMLIQLPVIGMMFKKTYWDSINKRPASEIINPKNLVVNYWAKSLATAERISEEIEMSPRVLKERQMSKLFLDVDLGPAPMPENYSGSTDDETTPYTLIEQHTYLDLDDDEYKEPYVVTFHKESGQVLRIAARFDEDGIKMNDDGGLARIEPIQYYTKFGFVPNPDGSFYDIGFGMLLGPLNESVNTLINQLVDAGTLNNMQGGGR